jgi:hypothetical protein
MDPNAALTQIREIVASWHTDESGDAIETGSTLVELIQGLDEWLSKGGFTPEAWSAETETLVAAITVPPGDEGTAYRLRLPNGRSAVIPETQDEYGELAAILDDTFPREA